MDGEVEKRPAKKEFDFDNYYSASTSVFSDPKPAFNFRTAESFLQKIQADEATDLSAFKEGASVEHKKFGTGVIEKVTPEDDDLIVEINFEKVGVKRLMAKFSKMKVIS